MKNRDVRKQTVTIDKKGGVRSLCYDHAHKKKRKRSRSNNKRTRGGAVRYLEKLVDLDLSGGIDIDGFDSRTNLVIGLTFTNVLNDLDEVLLVDLATSINVETTNSVRLDKDMLARRESRAPFFTFASLHSFLTGTGSRGCRHRWRATEETFWRGGPS